LSTIRSGALPINTGNANLPNPHDGSSRMANLTWISLGVLAAFAAAGVAIFARLGLGSVDTTVATTLRSLVMTGLLIAFSAATGSLRPLLGGKVALGTRAWIFVFLAGLCGPVSWLAYFLRVDPLAQLVAFF
jgi:uncharacterized membrane protein